ncbi:MAG: fused MFS/spermidine synthase [Bryobacteraceae bacterium]
MLLYSLTVFLSAFLLFQVQPIVAKMILPWFGGSSAVWSTCMLFFQVVLLLGYLYAHWLREKLAPRRQAAVHIAALAVSFAALPMLPNPGWKSAGMAHPSLTILALLSATVGLPYFLLSSTSPLLQAWYARAHREGMPYRLFALSNFASMLALLSYPFVVEPNLPVRIQGWVWSAAYVSFAALCGATAWRSSMLAAAPQAAAQEGAPTMDDSPAWTLRLLWLGLAASASILLLAVTNHLTQDVAAIPFLWILPLSVYLLSFIVCFESPRFYRRAVYLPLLGVALAFMAYRLWPYRTDFNPPWLGFLTQMPIRWIVVAFAVGLFACCMVCHGELARLKPHPRHLTGFYVTVSLGGAVGGLFVGLVAPNLFRAYYEFPIGLGLCAAIAFLVLARGMWRLAGGALWARPRWGAAALAVVLCGYLACLGVEMWEMVDGYRVVARNFYGLLRVEDEGNPRMDEDASRKLIHGTINHGEQFLREPYRRQPVTYFCPQSGIGLAMQAQEGRPRRIGILGLGCGTLAAYGRPGDTFRIYEINPLVLDIARTQFTYLRDTPARVEVVLGDGRLVLESEPSQQFDLLVMDAFSGDSVPVHLITLEAFRTYFRHLKPGGILAVNITNKYLDLEPVVERAAATFGKAALVYDYTPGDADFLCFGCSWTLILDGATAAAHPGLRHAGQVLRQERGFRAWTDDFSNMFGILR